VLSGEKQKAREYDFRAVTKVGLVSGFVMCMLMVCTSLSQSSNHAPTDQPINHRTPPSTHQWFALRSDLILLLFDPSKLDISDELKQVIGDLKPCGSKVNMSLCMYVCRVCT
jgi:hypothetical protein